MTGFICNHRLRQRASQRVGLKLLGIQAPKAARQFGTSENEMKIVL